MAISQFSGPYRFLSNFYMTHVVYEGDVYLNVENAYQAAKCANKDLRKYFCQLSPYKAKKLGYKVKLRDDWEQVKDSIMEELVRNKFTTDPNMVMLLLSTNNEELIEGNTWGDTYWGKCDGKGENKLGKILMKLREDIRNGSIQVTRR